MVFAAEVVHDTKSKKTSNAPLGVGSALIRKKATI